MIFMLIISSPGYFMLSLFIYMKYIKIAGESWLGSVKLKQVWPEIEGYRYYIEVVDADQLKFESENTKGLAKNKALPYAVALGINTNWLKTVK